MAKSWIGMDPNYYAKEKNGLSTLEEEKMNYLPTGVLKQDTDAPEYCDMYKEIQKVHQGKRGKITPDDFAKKI